MEIKFEKIDNVYMSEITITSNCNIHIEREELGMFTIESRGSKSGKYVPMEEGHYGDKYIIDVDMLGNIYPKYIKITSVSKPTYAEVNFAEQGGGGNSNSNIIYLDVSNFQNYIKLIIMVSVLVKYEQNGNRYVTLSSDISDILDEVSLNIFAVAVDLGLKLKDNDGVFTVQDSIVNGGYDKLLESMPHLTEEEFYDLNV